MRNRYKEHPVFLNPSSHFRPKYLYHHLSPKKAQKKNMECDRKTKLEQTIAMTNSQKKMKKRCHYLATPLGNSSIFLQFIGSSIAFKQ